MKSKHCSNCGKKINENAVVCLGCGAKVNTATGPKSKTTAVLMSVFLGLFAWAYTYKKTSTLFWGNLIATVCTFGIWGLFVAYPWSIIYMATRPSEFFTEGFD